MENTFYVATLLFPEFYEVNFSRDMSLIYPWEETSSRTVINNPRSACSPRAFANAFNACSPHQNEGQNISDLANFARIFKSEKNVEFAVTFVHNSLADIVSGET